MIPDICYSIAGICISGYLNIWISGYLLICTSGNLDIWMWSCGHLDIGISAHRIFGTEVATSRIICVVDLCLTSGCLWFVILIQYSVHLQSGLMCGAALLGALFLRVVFFQKTYSFVGVRNDSSLNGPNLLSTQGTINENGILTLIEFWWVAKIPEMVVPKVSHVRRSRPKTSDQPSLLLSLTSRCTWSSQRHVCAERGQADDFQGISLQNLTRIWLPEFSGRNVSHQACDWRGMQSLI